MAVKIIIALAVLVLLAAGTTYYFFNQYKKTQLLLNNPTMASKQEVKDITDKLGKLIELPQKEEPIVITVLDKNKLKGQEFFKNAENGDKVIVYTTSKKAILYRPTINKIIEVAPVNLGNNNTSTSQPIKIALYNGTTIVGMTNNLEKELTQKISNFSITTKDNAEKNNYEKTLVVDVSGGKQDLAKQLATLIQAQVSALPAGETVPKDTDLLVIIGADYKSGSAAAGLTPTTTLTPTITATPTVAP